MLSALACMFYKSESMLSFQRRMESRYKQSNLKTQFGVNKIPKDNQMRAIIGSINSEHFAPVFEEYLHRMQRGNYLAKYQIDGRYLITIDVTEYFSSKTINCNHCLTQEHRNGSITYSHKVVQPIISHPDYRQILPLMPEEVSNTDGQAKQDSEISAAKRLLPKLGLNIHVCRSYGWETVFMLPHLLLKKSEKRMISLSSELKKEITKPFTQR